jgi:hypothetical protein
LWIEVEEREARTQPSRFPSPEEGEDVYGDGEDGGEGVDQDVR